MSRNARLVVGALALIAILGGAVWAWRESQKVCCAFADDLEAVADAGDARPSKPRLGLVTSLPLYWPLGAEFGKLASGDAEVPWQRSLIERRFEIVPLDTLSLIPGLSPDDPETNPLEGLERLAIIQPRGLSPADNVAIDDWVRAGGQLLIMLDPMLTGHYELPLGDPRRPTDTALIPPVISRWGIVPSFSPNQTELREIELGNAKVPVILGSDLRTVVVDGGRNGCRTHESALIVRCGHVGEGTVTYLGDATVLEHRELVGEEGESLYALLEFAFPES